MSSPEKCKNLLSNRLLDLNSDLVLTPEDFQAMKRSSCGCDLDLAGYIDVARGDRRLQNKENRSKDIPGAV